MKKLILLIALSGCTMGKFSISDKEKPLIFGNIIEIKANKNQLFDRANVWFADLYNSSNYVLQVRDREAGILVGKASFDYYPGETVLDKNLFKGTIGYTIKIFIKDNKYKYEITNFYHDADGYGTYDYDFGLITVDETSPVIAKYSMRSYGEPVWQDLKRLSEDYAKNLSSRLENSMNKSLMNW